MFRFVSLDMFFGVPLLVKTSRGAGCEPPARAPLRRKVGTRLGGAGGSHQHPTIRFCGFQNLHQQALPLLFQGKRIQTLVAVS